MKRKWVDDQEHLETWNVPFSVAKHSVYMYWTHPTLYPCDQKGFRVPLGFNSFEEKYVRSEGAKRIFCLGGSTTFGLFDSYENSYPHQLQKSLRDVEVFNFGLCGMDSTGSMHTLLDLIRLGYVPDVAIFLDGINEKQGWVQASDGQKEYEEISWQYRCFYEAMYNNNVPMTVRWRRRETLTEKLKNLLNGLTGSNLPKTVHDPMRFVEAQSSAYTATNKAIMNIAGAWGFKTKFFLEPTVWDVWAGAHDMHHNYMKSLYSRVAARNIDVVDLSNQTSLSAEDFIEWKHLTSHGYTKLARAIVQYIG